MSSTTRTLKRLGVGLVSGAMLLATPYVGVTTAFAATPSGPGSVAIVSQTTNTGSTLNDGTNNTVKISATVDNVPGTGQLAVAGVRFYSQDTSTPTPGTPVLIGTDTTYPYSIEWAPAAGSYNEIAEAFASNGTVIDSDTKAVTIGGTLSSVHITSPTDGASIGQSGGFLVVSGTRSADLPAITVTARTRDNSNGALTAAGAGSTVIAGTPSPTTPNTWSTTVAVPACPAGAGTCDVIIDAVAVGSGVGNTSDEAVEALLYDQTVTTFTVTPSTASRAVNQPATYTVTATDQSGNPVAGLTVVVTDNSGTATETPASGTTGTDGTFKFVGQDSAAETTTYTVQSELNGASYQPGVDFSRTATLVTYNPTAASATITADPQKALYASQSEYTNSAGAAATDPSASNTPVVDICSTDQNGNALANNATPPANLIVTVTRSVTNPAATPATTTSTATVTPVQDTRTGKESCYVIPHAAAPTTAGTYGSDTFNAYYENNGTPGYQAGSSDVTAASLTLNFAMLDIQGVNNTQAQQGDATTVSFTVVGADGTPFAGRKIALSQSGGSFSATGQPTGTTYTSATSAVCTTDAAGRCSVVVSSPTTGTVTVTATDSITDATTKQIATGVTKSTAVSYRSQPVTLTEADNLYPFCCNPASLIIRPTGGNDYVWFNYAQPGDAVKLYYQLYDANGQPLRGVTTQVTLDHGFFTPNCVGDVYTGCTFTPAIADGNKVGNLKNLGSTITVTSDDNGIILVTEAIGRDTEFDNDGYAYVKTTISANGGTVDNGYNQSGNEVNSNFNEYWYGWSTDGDETGYNPYNGSSVELLSPDGSAAPSGYFSDFNSPVRFITHIKDQFGNLARTTWNCDTVDDVQIHVTGNAGVYSDSCGGGGTTKDTQDVGSFTNNVRVNYLYNNSTSKTGDPVTVTATWPANVTTFKGASPATTPQTYTVQQTKSNKTDSFSLNFYQVDLTALQYTFASTPGNTVPINTAVTTSVTVKDQKGNPVPGLCVDFIRSGPNDTAGNSQTGGTLTGCQVDTNAQGKAGTSYSSGTPGTATVTAIVKDDNGNELSRGVQNVEFTKGTPTQTGSPSFTLSVHSLLVGQCGTLTVNGPAGDVISVLAKGAPSTVFKKIATLSPGQHIRVCPSTNTIYQVSDASKLAPQQNMIVKAIQTLVVTRHGQGATFAGHVIPGVVGRSVVVYYYTAGEHVQYGGLGKVQPGGNFSFSGTVNRPGKLVHFFAQTYADQYNASGRSRLVDVQF